MCEFISPNQTHERYELRTRHEPNSESRVERELRESGIAATEMPLSPDDFQSFSQGFDAVMHEYPDLLCTKLIVGMAAKLAILVKTKKLIQELIGKSVIQKTTFTLRNQPTVFGVISLRMVRKL